MGGAGPQGKWSQVSGQDQLAQAQAVNQMLAMNSNQMNMQQQEKDAALNTLVFQPMVEKFSQMMGPLAEAQNLDTD